MEAAAPALARASAVAPPATPFAGTARLHHRASHLGVCRCGRSMHAGRLARLDLRI
jgi:hypothetical protein